MVGANDLRRLVASFRWTFAHTMPEIPHEYALRHRESDQEGFTRLVRAIRSQGQDRPFKGRRLYRYLDVDEYMYWVMSAPTVPDVEVFGINRAKHA